MKKKITGVIFGLLFSFILLIPAGCLKDNVRYTYTITRPVYMSLSQARANVKATAAAPLVSIGKIYTMGKFVFLNELEKGIHIIDNSNPAGPRNIGFINIPGNEDMAIHGNTLYADSYTDLLAIDITNPQSIVVKKTLQNIFQSRISYFVVAGNPDSTFVITDWITKDTTVDYPTGPRYVLPYSVASCSSCMMAANVPAASSAPTQGTGGSMAKFTLVNDWLYAVDNPNLDAIQISSPEDPQLIKEVQVGFQIETIYPFKDKLFIGANNGVFMYDIQNNPGDPAPAGEFTHVRACDPVIADDKYAWVTLSDGTRCQGFDNELQILDISNFGSPSLVKTYPMTHPLGLAKDGEILFLCDTRDGLKVYNAADPSNLQLLRHFKDASPMDVIAMNGLALVLAEEGLFEYDYSDIGNIRLVGKLTVSKN
ncbi:MAG: LVIVD repeat-containing protein [Chitinophagales bacterium]